MDTVDVALDQCGFSAEQIKAGQALVYCAADARLDGRMGRCDGPRRRYWIETYGLHADGSQGGQELSVEASSAAGAVRKLGRLLGVEIGTVTRERD